MLEQHDDILLSGGVQQLINNKFMQSQKRPEEQDALTETLTSTHEDIIYYKCTLHRPVWQRTIQDLPVSSII